MYDLQKASISKRLSAFLFDIIIFSIAAVGFIWMITSITNFGAQVEKYDAHYDRYAAEYGLDRDITQDEFLALPEEEQQRYRDVEELFKNDEVVFRDYQLVINLALLSVSVGLFLAFMLLEFAVPLFFGNGQTLGKKIFAVGVMRVDGVKVTAPIVFVRGILGKYTIETMVPLFLVFMSFMGMMGIMGLIVLVLLALFEVFLVIYTHTNSLIHDALSQTVTVDLASQMIFESTEEMIEYKKRIHASEVERAEYK